MFYHLIPLAEIKRSATTYWRPGRDMPASDDAWVLLLELESGCAATIVDIPAGADVDGEEFARVRAAADVFVDALRRGRTGADQG
jgi:hypothetical protein